MLKHQKYNKKNLGIKALKEIKVKRKKCAIKTKKVYIVQQK